MARGALRVKKGAALVFADGTRGVASSDDYMGMRERIVAIGGEVRARPLATIVSVNGTPVNALATPAPAVKKWAEGETKRYETRGVLAGRYQGRGKGGSGVGLSGETLRTHALVDGATKTPCGMSEENLSDVNERGVPTCGRCAAAVARFERKG
jgi:hypothetical protein